ncbi:MAG TPA: FAD-dependent oxidoreductase [Acidimicrobiia bacterium]|nr:FAD-dependent oxidoreductase [Acidimicrobiia bacterium]
MTAGTAPEHYDAAVIGGGVGGLSVAARLVAAGCRVLVLERLKEVGGRFTDVTIDGFHVSTGGVGIEIDGGFQECFDLVGAPFDVVAPPEPVLRYKVAEGYVDAGERGSLRRLIMAAARSDEEGSRVFGALKRALAWEEPSPGMSLVEWLGSYTDNKELIGIFAGICEATHGPGERVPARQFIQFIKVQGGYRSFGFARYGNRAVIQALADGIRGRGGEIRTRATVKGIAVERQRVTGLRYEHRGREVTVTADAVVSNAGPKVTVGLAGREAFDSGYLALVDRMRPMEIVTVVSVDRRPLHEFPGTTIPSLAGTRRISYLATPTLIAPESSDGGHLTESYGMVRDPSNWAAEVEANLADLEDHLPRFDRSKNVLRVNCYSGAWPCYHAVPGDDVPQRTPVEMLYNVGDGVKPDGWSGLAACAETGRLVAADILSRLSGRP